MAVLDHTVLGTHEDLEHNYRGGTDFISANYTINHVDAENHGTEVAGVDTVMDLFPYFIYT